MRLGCYVEHHVHHSQRWLAVAMSFQVHGTLRAKARGPTGGRCRRLAPLDRRHTLVVNRRCLSCCTAHTVYHSDNTKAAKLTMFRSITCDGFYPSLTNIVSQNSKRLLRLNYTNTIERLVPSMPKKIMPSFNLYCGDLLKDKNFMACDGKAKALWVWMLVHLHDMPLRGEFRLRADLPPMDNQSIANLLSYPIAEFESLLSQMDSNGVTERIAGAIANRRMVRERQLHEIKSKAGIKGNEVRWQTDSTLFPDDSQNIAPSDSDSLSDSPAAAAAGNNFTAEQLRDRWNSIIGVKLCKRLDGALLIRIKKLAKEHSSEWWGMFFAEISNSKFLTGRAKPKEGKDPMRADFDWATGPIILGKIMSGRYSDDPEKTADQKEYDFIHNPKFQG